MLTGLKLALGVTAVAATGTIGGLNAAEVQDDTAPKQKNNGFAASLLAQDARLSRKVSAELDNVEFKEVLKWLSSNGVQFIVSSEDAPKSTISLKLKDQPLSKAMNYIAEAFGGHWERRDEVYVFKKGKSPFNAYAPEIRSGEARFFGADAFKNDPKLFEKFKMDPKTLEEMKAQGLHFDGKTFQWDSKMLDQMKKEGMFDAKAFKMDPKMMEQLKKEGMHFDSKIYQVDPKKLEQLKKEGMYFDGKAFKMDPKMMEEMKKQGMRFDGDAFKFDPKMFDGKALKMDEKSMKEFQELAKRQAELGRKMAEQYRKEHGNREMTPAERKKFEAEMEKFHKEMEGLHKKMEGSFHFDNKMFNELKEHGARAYTWDGKAFQEMKGNSGKYMWLEKDKTGKHVWKSSDKKPKDWDKKMKDMRVFGRADDTWVAAPGRFGLPGREGHGVRVNVNGAKELLKSLSPSQRERHRRQGYLTISDLTQNQRKMIGDPQTKDFTMSVTIDGENLTIKGR